MFSSESDSDSSVDEPSRRSDVKSGCIKGFAIKLKKCVEKMRKSYFRDVKRKDIESGREEKK